MLVYEKINISDGIDVDMSDKSKKSVFSVIIGPYLCDGCYNMIQKCNKLKNIAIVHIKEIVYRTCSLFISKHEAKKLITNSNLIDKKGAL